jgi:hypothetical protein
MTLIRTAPSASNCASKPGVRESALEWAASDTFGGRAALSEPPVTPLAGERA